MSVERRRDDHSLARMLTMILGGTWLVFEETFHGM